MSGAQVHDLDATAQVGDAPASTAADTPPVINDDGSTTLTLKQPVEQTTQVSGGTPQTTTISEIRIRRPKGGDLRAIASLTDTGMMIGSMFKRLSGLDVSVFDKLELEDALAVQEVIGNFFPASQVTGKPS